MFDLVEAHFVTRGRERELAATLEGRAQQFRSVQKRLLVRFKVGVRLFFVCGSSLVRCHDAAGVRSKQLGLRERRARLQSLCYPTPMAGCVRTHPGQDPGAPG